MDGISLWDPYIAQMLEEKQARLLVSKTDFWTTTVVAEEFYNKNHDALINLLVALKESLFYLANHQEQANQWLSETMKVDAKLIHEGSKHNTNYNTKEIKDVSVAPVEDLIKILEAIAEFNLSSRLVKTKAAIRTNVNMELYKKAEDKFGAQGKYDPSAIKVK